MTIGQPLKPKGKKLILKISLTASYIFGAVLKPRSRYPWDKQTWRRALYNSTLCKDRYHQSHSVSKLPIVEQNIKLFYSNLIAVLKSTVTPTKNGSVKTKSSIKTCIEYHICESSLVTMYSFKTLQINNP